AELLGAPNGIGYLMLRAQTAADSTTFLAICFAIVLIFVAGERLVIVPLERRFERRWGGWSWRWQQGGPRSWGGGSRQATCAARTRTASRYSAACPTPRLRSSSCGSRRRSLCRHGMACAMRPRTARLLRRGARGSPTSWATSNARNRKTV